MKKPFAVFDIDGTIFRSSLLIEVLEALIQKSIFPTDANAKIKPALVRWHDRATVDAYQDYIAAVVAAFESNIKGVKESDLVQAADEVIEQKFRQTYLFTRNLISSLAETHILLAISGSPSQVVSKFCSNYGFTDYVATEYHTEDGIFTGEHTFASDNKDQILSLLTAKHGLSTNGSIAVGDTKGDIELLNAVEQPIAFNPDGDLRQAAEQNGWQIVLERKSQIYSLEPKDGTYKLVKTN